MFTNLTVIIPCKNEESYIAKTLRSLKKQIGSEDFRIIIADADSTDRTIEVIKEKSHTLNLDVTITQGGSAARGRNNGAELSKTKFILFLDADTTFTRNDAIYDCLKKMKSGKYDCISTNPVYFGEYDPLAKFLFSINRLSTWFLSKRHPFAIGAFTMITSKKFFSLGGYDENAMHTEDWLLSKKISPERFLIIPNLITQDNRRFKRYGYFRMINLMVKNFINRNNYSYFLRDQNYWT